MVAKLLEGTGGIGHKIEELPSMYGTVRITGGEPHARRFRNDYSKEGQAGGKDNPFPDVSPEWVLGGIRSGTL